LLDYSLNTAIVVLYYSEFLTSGDILL
jgi:hypothetical protein